MKSFLILITVLLCQSLIGQTIEEQYPKKQLYEVFTSSTCGPCAAANPVIDELLENNHGKYSLIKYQVNWPGNGDDYYQPETAKRVYFYSVSGVPSLFVNGSKISAYDLSQTYFNQNAEETTPVQLTIEASITQENKVIVKTSVLSNTEITEETSLHLMLVEKDTYKNKDANGESVFHNVLMAYLTNANGRKMETIEAGNEIIFKDTLSLEGLFVEEAWDLQLVGFVQNNAKEILQSEMVDVDYSALALNSITFTVSDSLDNPLSEVEVFVHKTVMTDNNGQTTFLSQDGEFEYVINKVGYFPIMGTISFSEDAEYNFVLKKPNSQIFESFDFYENYTIPDQWKSFSTSWGIRVHSKQLLFWQYSDTPDNNIILLPKVNLAIADKLTFNAGNKHYKPKLELGTMSNPGDINTFVALKQFEPSKDSLTLYSYDFSEYTDTLSYLAFKMPYTNTNAYFLLDDVLLNTDINSETFALTLKIDDGMGNWLKNVTVQLGDKKTTTNENGIAQFIDLDNGQKNLEITLDGYYSMDTTIAINGNNRIDEISLVMVSANDNTAQFVNLYPNPTTGMLFLENTPGFKQIEIFTVTGRKIYQQELSPQTLTPIDMQRWEHGFYFVKLTGDNRKSIINKIIKK
jgi:thiol-disulfide isomerase/thioredoxin